MLKYVLNRILGRPSLPERPSYEESRAVLERHAGHARRQLAGRTGIEPEILYYLATDADPAVRRLVAENAVTPAKADRLLAEDGDEDVRAALARKIARLVPTLDEAHVDKTRDLVIETLDRLAADQAPRVRAIVADELKAMPSAPRSVIRRLARDAELCVAVPILEYSPLLSDADLMEIVALAQVGAAVAAVARRRNLPSAVSQAIIATLDIPATAALIANPTAEISDAGMDVLLARAAEIEAWHEPLVGRPNLSVRVVRRIAAFVSSSLVERLALREHLDAGLADELKRRARDRIEHGALEDPHAPGSAEARVHAAQRGGGLDDHFVSAAAEDGAYEVVCHALAVLSHVPAAAARRMLEARNAHAVTALVWKAGLPMRVAVVVQTALLKLPSKDVLSARGGTGYPLSPEEMTLQLALFGLS